MKDSCRKLTVAEGRGGGGGGVAGQNSGRLGWVHAQYREGWGVEDSCRNLPAAEGVGG